MNIRYLLLPLPISWAKGTKQGSGLGRTLCLAALFVTFATAAWADVDLTSNNFPDSKFLDIVKGRSINTNGDKKLSDAELQAVTTMDVSNKDIQSLKGIEYFTNLQTLKCNANKLEQLDVTALTNLVTLECYDNKTVMTSLNATGCTNLQTLKCYNCKLKNLSLGRCSSLRTLYCYSNQLTTLNLSTCTRLSTVRCFKNKFRDDDMVQFISKLPLKATITNLDLCYNNEDADAGNKIMHAEVRAAKAKNWIIRKGDSNSWDKYAGIIAVDETTFPDANFLACVGQYDTDNDGILSDDEVAAVTRMYVDSKGIQDMTGIECFEKLTYLYCCKNQIRDQWADILISYLPTVKGTLRFYYREGPTGNYMTQKQLEAANDKGWSVYEYRDVNDTEWWLYEDNHSGILIDETTFPDEEFRWWVGRGIDENRDGYLSDDERTAVKKIDLLFATSSYSRDIKSFQGIGYFPELEVLHCGYAQPTSLDLSGNPLLTSLTCIYSNLTSIDLSVCPQLKKLSFNCNFDSLDLSVCPQLTYVSVGGKIGSINVSNHMQLEQFYTNSGEITSIDLSGCSQLKKVSIIGNKLASINLSGCTQLEYFAANNNELTSLDLSDCKQLQNCFIPDNPLTSLKASDLPLLKQIELHNVQLTTLDLSNCTSLQYLNSLYGNPLTSINVSGCTSLNSLNFSNMQLTSINVTGCTSINYVAINMNQLQGEGMDAFVESMPVCAEPENAYFNCMSIFDPAEQNRLTPAQAAKLREKGWPVQAYYRPFGTWLDYDGYGNGDVDGSGTVDADDVKAVVNHILGLTDTDTDVEMVAARAMEESATPFYSPIVADTNGDGVVDIADVTQIISKVGTVVYKKPEK